MTPTTRPSTAGMMPLVPLGSYPTPLHHLPRLSEHLGLEVLAKREDLSGLGLGGNKVRKLRVVLAAARAESATVVLTQGGVQSNHCAATAVAAPMLGMRAELFLHGDPPAVPTGNVLVDGMAGATPHFTGAATHAEVDALVEARAGELRAAGEVPFVIPLGASDPLGVAATVTGVEEVDARLPAGGNTRIVVAAGSLGTLAGLTLGTWVLDRDWSVEGFSVLWPAERARAVLDGLLDAARRRHFPGVAPRPNVELTDEQLGGGYGVPTEQARRAAALALRLEGLLLDGTYTAKAFAGLLEGVRSGRYDGVERIVFWHTGGLGGVFG